MESIQTPENYSESKEEIILEDNIQKLDKITILWDYDNIPIPTQVDPKYIVDKITTLAKKYSEYVSIEAYLNFKINEKIEKHINTLIYSGIRVIYTPCNHEKENTDKAIIFELGTKINSKNEGIILISGDADFHPYLARLARHGIKIILIHAHNAYDEYINNLLWTESIFFDDFIFTKEELPKIIVKKIEYCKHFNTKSSGCEYKKSCKFEHRCSECNSEDHGLYMCQKAVLTGKCIYKQEVKKLNQELRKPVVKLDLSKMKQPCRNYNRHTCDKEICEHEHVCELCRGDHIIKDCDRPICLEYNENKCNKRLCAFKHCCIHCFKIGHSGLNCKTKCSNCLKTDHTMKQCKEICNFYLNNNCHRGETCLLKHG
jgi:uncharacterized LabA/DUF88 family protein